MKKAQKLPPIPSQSYLKLQFNYDPITGHLTYPVGDRAGMRAGSVHKPSNTRIIYYAGKYLPEHKIVWCYVHGTYPSAPVMHKNNDKLDNRIFNLTLGRDEQRRGTSARSKSGLAGISWYAPTEKWRVTVYAPKPIHIGYFRELDEAKAAYAAGCRKFKATPPTLAPVPTPTPVLDTDIQAWADDTPTTPHEETPQPPAPKGWVKV